MKDLPVKSLKGVGDAVAGRLAKLGIVTVNDLLEHFPRRYEDRSQRKTIREIVPGEFALFTATVLRGEINRIHARVIVRLHVADSTGQAVLVWFNQPYRTNQWKPGMKIRAYGRASYGRGALQIESPEVDLDDGDESLHSDRIVPIYRLTQGLGSRTLRKLISMALDSSVAEGETLPNWILQERKLMSRSTALREIHFPSEWPAMYQAKRRLVFEELFVLQCALIDLRRQRNEIGGSELHRSDGDLVQRVKEKFPFSLTRDQQAAYGEISRDMESTRPMHRLLQGDVGSGKTAVALLALCKTIENGCQGALMAPTEILAEQHFQSCQALLASSGVRSVLLTGRIKGASRNSLLQRLRDGEVDLVVGTQALLQPDVVFRRLGLAVTDEQHRFGVAQRALLQEKGQVPHTLVMSATPIPRTMALTLYGDMDVSTIRELPPGRKPVITAVRSGAVAREKVYRFLLSEVAAGRQGYVVCPLVEDSDRMEAQSAVTVFRELTSTVLQGASCGLLHGRMNPGEKEAVMNDFVSGRLGILISTTVIEVGVNVPNATVMIVEDADRFGLAQLHQLRGRVGRGDVRSYCVLLQDAEKAPSERLQVLVETTDGFVVAEKDLLLRGPGQFLGFRQHGLPEMKVASLADDAQILDEARNAGLQAMENPVYRQFFHELVLKKLPGFFAVTFAG